MKGFVVPQAKESTTESDYRRFNDGPDLDHTPIYGFTM